MNTIILVAMLSVGQANTVVFEGSSEFYDLMSRVPNASEPKEDTCRVWVDKKKQTYDGMYTGYKKGMVTIRLKDKKTVEIKLTSLSMVDQKWVRKELKRVLDLKRKAMRQ
jgi:hypothetical protein